MYTRASESDEEDFDKYDEERLHMEQMLSASTVDIDMPMRIAIPLDNVGIRRLRDLVVLDRKGLMAIPRLGCKAADEVEALLARFGLSLGMKI